MARILSYGHYQIACLVEHNKLIDILDVFHGTFAINRYLLEISSRNTTIIIRG
ncbi:MAG: hypothetical protein GWN16_04080 [Calditrichae bacterium]|nr:hypothetical protein [Calditrichia bacterium]